MIPVCLFLSSVPSFLLYGFFQLFTGSLNYQATSTWLGKPFRAPSIVLLYWELFTSGSGLWQAEAISNVAPFFKNSERKECCSDPDHHVSYFRISCGHYLPKLLDGHHPQNGETILSQMAKGILGDSFWVMQFSTSLDSSCSCNTSAFQPHAGLHG